MSLPGADELFRTTGGMGLQASSPADRRRKANGEARVPGPAGESDSGADGAGADPAQAPEGASREEHSAADADAAESRTRGGDRGAVAAQPGRRPQQSAPAAASPAPQEAVPASASAVQPQRRRGAGRGANRRPSGRERHDEKITVYVSAEELMDLEHARLVLRGEHGLAVDRGRIVREAVAVVLADLESRGDASILVRRLRGR
ncbi:hypothetical protein GCM10015535_21550 [Streptomyces gelaticus]|uniref:Cobyrinic acid a,c-diamide synthase n=1 Tax=Streptomyces gelaticus TaxID=285446 RepID=A0ABQ2VWL7_9ACTN|nr:hypothetical protein [Streptomyces gelaticus]GGV81608.1 hypothetical protein GCM10015535_21550 [Streptomyces gelaticus]